MFLRLNSCREKGRACWKVFVGVMSIWVILRGGNFCGCGRFGIYTSKTAAESPWQNGLCERHGGVWKEVFFKACEECIPRAKSEYNELFDKVNESKNSMMRKHGFSLYQNVLGCDLRVPQSILEENSV